MAMKFLVRTNDGERTELPDAKRFSHYINNVRFWFAVHRPLHGGPDLVVSHWASGGKVCTVGPGHRIAGVGMNNTALAKQALDRFVAEKGAARVEAVLRAAEPD